MKETKEKKEGMNTQIINISEEIKFSSTSLR